MNFIIVFLKSLSDKIDSECSIYKIYKIEKIEDWGDMYEKELFHGYV